MTKALVVESLDLSGPVITSSPAFPIGDAASGSYHICTTDGSWWQFTPGLGWGIAARSQGQTTPIINGELTPLLPGAPFVFENGLAKNANASSLAKAAVSGLVVSAVAPTLLGQALLYGLIVLPVAAWTAITGEIGGLTPGAKYYLGLDPATMTTTPPNVVGQCIVPIGQAIDEISFAIAPRLPTRL